MKTKDWSERPLTSSAAIKLALLVAEKEKLTLTLRKFGTYPKTVSCEVKDKNGWWTKGTGKGIDDQSEASAIFESLEHYFYYTENISNLIKYSDVEKRSLRGNIPDLSNLSDQNYSRLAKIPFYSLRDPSQETLFPAFLSNCNYVPSDTAEQLVLDNYSLMRFSTNSGTASGIESTDAILHAMLEVIERDSVGIELLRTVIKRKPFALRKVVSDLPVDLVEIIDRIEAENSCLITIWNITTDIGIPACLACLEKDGEKYFGSGASISPNTASNRSVLEALQVFHAHQMYSISRLRSRPMSAINLPMYARCLLQWGIYHPRGGTVCISFEEIESSIDYNNKITPKTQVELITARLEYLGMPAFCRNIYSGEISVDQVIIPKLERVHLIGTGTLVAPGLRGLLAIA